MIWKNYQYNWLDLSPANVYATKIALSNVSAITGQDTNIINNINDHGSSASNTLESWRAFVFDWYIFGITKPTRGTAWELLNSHINIEPYVNADPFKRLDFQSDTGEDRRVMVKVNEKPRGTNKVNDSRIKCGLQKLCLLIWKKTIFCMYNFNWGGH